MNIPELGPVTAREYLIHIGVLAVAATSEQAKADFAAEAPNEIKHHPGEVPIPMSITVTTERSNEIKHRLRQQGQTLKDFAQANGFKYRTVSDVVRGLRAGNFGEGREVRLKLGLPVND